MPTTIAAADLETLTVLRELVAEVRGLRQDMRERAASAVPGEYRTQSTLSREDRARLARLLPAIAGALGSEPFLARDLFEHAAPAVRLVRRGLTPRRIGRLFRRAAGEAVAGYLVEAVDVELGAVLWRVVQVAEFPENEKVSVPPRDPRGRL
jgi:hypothetical protein